MKETCGLLTMLGIGIVLGFLIAIATIDDLESFTIPLTDKTFMRKTALMQTSWYCAEEVSEEEITAIYNWYIYHWPYLTNETEQGGER